MYLTIYLFIYSFVFEKLDNSVCRSLDNLDSLVWPLFYLSFQCYVLDEKIEVIKYPNNPCDIRKSCCFRAEVHGKGFYAKDNLKENWQMKKVIDIMFAKYCDSIFDN